MGITTIEWAHYTFNMWRGCQRVSEGCRNCYAEAFSKRNPSVLGEWGPNGQRVIAAESYWKLPLRWNAEAQRRGERRRVFCASLADVFEDRPELVEPRERLFDVIALTPMLDWLLLTKRPENIRRLRPRLFEHLPNVWLGTSVENQQTADERIPHLLAAPASVHFLSCEPLLGAVNLTRWVYPACEPICPIDWVIAGGESGANARPMHPAWVRSLRDQCQSAGVPFFFKQWGEYAPWQHSKRVGKKAAGRLLDGVEWNEVPNA